MMMMTQFLFVIQTVHGLLEHVGGTQLKTTGVKVEEIPVVGADGQHPAHKILTYEGTTVIEETVEEGGSPNFI